MYVFLYKLNRFSISYDSMHMQLPTQKLSLAIASYNYNHSYTGSHRDSSCLHRLQVATVSNSHSTLGHVLATGIYSTSVSLK